MGLIGDRGLRAGEFAEGICCVAANFWIAVVEEGLTEGSDRLFVAELSEGDDGLGTKGCIVAVEER